MTSHIGYVNMSSMKSELTPAYFIGHGSPMNLVDSNRFVDNLIELGKNRPKPKAVLCISAHWITHGTFVEASPRPKQIYDFSGFPDELYKIRYEPPGSPEIASSITKLNEKITATKGWGIDHGTWALMKFIFPEADVPILQLSLDQNLTVEGHLKIAQSLQSLRSEGVMVVASGNIVHNLRQISRDPNAPAQPWALEYEEFVLKKSQANVSPSEMAREVFVHPLMKMAHPSPDHLIPLLYFFGFKLNNESVRELIRGIQNSSISMAAVATLSP